MPSSVVATLLNVGAVFAAIADVPPAAVNKPVARLVPYSLYSLTCILALKVLPWLIS
jgi:hypothetical protein